MSWSAAEKLREPLLAAFKAKFGIELYEGYGCTEMGPVVAVKCRRRDPWAMHQTGRKLGTVGHPLPGVATRIVDLEGGATLAAGRARAVCCSRDPPHAGLSRRPGAHRGEACATAGTSPATSPGSTRMALSPSQTAGPLQQDRRRDGAACQSRGGDRRAARDRSVRRDRRPDTQRGERLVVYFVGTPEITAEAIWSSPRRDRPARLWLPKPQDIRSRHALPLLASGKLDLRRIKQMTATPAPESAISRFRVTLQMARTP